MKVDELVHRSGLVKTKKQLDSLKSQGFKAIISLEEMNIPLQSYAKKIGIKIYNISIPEYEVPTMRETLKMIAAVERTKRTGAKTLIHCEQGRQRSGVMSTLYLASKGMHPLQAYHLHDYGSSQIQKQFIMEKGPSLAEMMKKRVARKLRR